MSFDQLGLNKSIVKAINEKGYTSPSPIQAQAIPVVLQGKDLMASAQTGTGKTAAFVLPLLQRLSKGQRPAERQVRTLIITPTRELAAQVQTNIRTYSKHLALNSLAVFGGVNINPQKSKLRLGVDLLVATPGRLLDLYNQNAIDFRAVETLVLDEADRMLDMGFIHDIRKIQTLLPKQKQTLLFSATFSGDIRKLARATLDQPIEIDVAPRNTTVESVAQVVHPVDKKQKTRLLKHLIEEQGWHQVLVFSRTKHGANRLATSLADADIPAAAIHGNKSQANRTRALANFKNGKLQVLVATDIAARGIDISELPRVVNFDLPNVPEDYVHRIGRTGRAGANGKAVSLVSADEAKQLRDIERFIGNSLEREEVEGFEPGHQVPESAQLTPAKKTHRPRHKPKRSGGDNRGQRKRKPGNRKRKPNTGRGGNQKTTARRTA